jgi:hypothetical protein
VYEDGLPLGLAVIMSKKSVCVTSEMFMTWLKYQFISRKPSGKVFNFLDGRLSQVSDTGILDLANESDIILCLPNRLRPYLQPL